MRPMAMAMDVVPVTMPTDSGSLSVVGRPQARTGPFVLGSSGPDYPLLTLSSYRIGRSVPRGQLEPASSRKRKIGDMRGLQQADHRLFVTVCHG
jgi:hypothetical protein